MIPRLVRPRLSADRQPFGPSSSLASSNDGLTGAGQCGVPLAGAVMGRCGYGPRLPLLVISPFARQNYVDHTVADQTSILRFIEDNFGLGQIDQAAPKSVAEGGSFDQIAGSLNSLFDFDRNEITWGGDRDDFIDVAFRWFDFDRRFDRDHRDQRSLILDPITGEKVQN
jgi:hypothetical protein